MVRKGWLNLNGFGEIKLGDQPLNQVLVPYPIESALSGVIKHPDRAEAERFYNFPYEALEESLANAVYHRGYDESEPIEVRISPEVIIIVNYPGPDRSVRLDQLREGKAIPRRYRNRRIGASMRSRRNPQTSAIPLFPGRVSLFQGFPNDSESSQGNFTTRAPRLPWRRRG